MIFNKDIVHVVYASDDRFSEIMGISLLSLYENSKDVQEIVIYILDSGISAENKSKIEAISKKYNRTNPVWIKAKNISSELNVDVAVDRGSLSQYARLFISSVLPENISRVIYLDCDIIIKQSIGLLWNMNMNGKTIAALKDAFSRNYRANIDLKPNDIMFNSGVMLVDLERWKKLDIEGKLLNFISSKHGKIQQGDQGALNAVLSKDTFCFEPKFNSITVFFDFNYKEMLVYRKPPEFYSEEQIMEAINEPAVIHFTTSILSVRPWIKGCRHIYTNEWLKYKAMSPWADNALWEDNRSPIKKVFLNILEKLPRKMMVCMAGIMHSYLRPFVNKIKNN